VVAHQLLLVASVAALAGVGLRLADHTGASGLERVVGAAVLAAAAAVIETLALGLVGLGGSTVPLAVAAGVTWLAARLALPAPAESPAAELAAWWGRMATPTRIALVALAGVWLTWAIWLFRYPVLGADSMIYHVPEVVQWIHNGRPGSIPQVYPGYPVGAYPLTNEVLLTWASGISRSFAPVIMWAPAMLSLLVAAGWVGLRALRVPPAPATLAIATVALAPGLTHWQRNGAHTDLPAITWLVCAGALCAASVERPALLAPMVVAIGLAVGTKTTTLPLLGLVLVIAAVIHRRRLKPLARPLLLASIAALTVGGFWYARNLVRHGSPLWPFVATSWGDPLPEIITPSGTNLPHDWYSKFLDRPWATVRYIAGDWANPFGGSVLLIFAGLLAPLAARRKAVMAAAGVTAASLLTWMNAPFTGLPKNLHGSGTFTTMRYLMPTVVAAALTLALAGRERGSGRLYALGGLTVCLGTTLWQLFGLGYPAAPSPLTLLAGGAAGAAVGGGLWLGVRGREVSPRHLRLAAAPALVAAGLALAVGGSHFVDRYLVADAPEARNYASASNALLRWFVARPDFADGERPIAFTVVTNAAFAGNRLQHRIDLIPPREGCGRTRGRARSAWVIVNRAWGPSPCFKTLRPRWTGGEFTVYDGRQSQLPAAASEVARR